MKGHGRWLAAGVTTLAFQSGMTLLQGEETIGVLAGLAVLATAVLLFVAAPRERAKKH